MNIYDLDSLKALSDEPSSEDEFSLWSQQSDVAGFLTSDIGDEYVILYASMPHVFIHAVFYPKKMLLKITMTTYFVGVEIHFLLGVYLVRLKIYR
ncbi:hypothetical protein ACMYQ1_19160 [Shewanella oncorhynchi]|uniref:hypothetical protein n=1 Tax=Shewanella oncorhynchi TaxID=2726434 RepID=UPI0039EFBE38